MILSTALSSARQGRRHPRKASANKVEAPAAFALAGRMPLLNMSDVVRSFKNNFLDRLAEK